MTQNQKWYGVYRIANGFPHIDAGLLSESKAEAEMMAARRNREYVNVKHFVCEVLIPSEAEVSHV